MVLTIKGCKDVALAAQIESAAFFYAQELLSPQMRKHITVTIEFRTAIKDLGNCMIADFNEWNKARFFEIQLKRHRSHESTLRTLAHEFIHLKQFAKGELNDENTKWKGQLISEDTSYFDLPWEVEAASLEPILYGLYEQYLEETKYET
jgi:hypothetical protein